MNGTYTNIDCMELMANLKDKEIDLAIVDPPYGIDYGNVNKFGKHTGKAFCRSKNYSDSNDNDWDKEPPSPEYFKELFRVSKNQIIFGANHFIERINKNSSCWLVWDKKTGDNNFADCELAWTSFELAVRKFEYMWKGMFQANMKQKEIRIHETQKPVALYEWILRGYAKSNDLILDTHVGSASSLIACENLGFKYVGCEKNFYKYQKSLQRLEAHLAQGKLFQVVGRDVIRLEQPSMFA